MTEPLTPRPAATVMLVRDGADGLDVFLMRRHSRMHFAPRVMVFPGGGVDDRDRHAEIAWAGPPPDWWAQRFGVENELAEALVCAAARETFEESGVLFAGPADDPHSIVGDVSVYRDSRLALADNTLSFAEFMRAENLVLRADLLRPWANWVTPEAERTRRYDTYFFVARCPTANAPTGRTPNPTAPTGPPPKPPSRTSPRAAICCCRQPGPSWIRWPGAPSPKSSRWNAKSSPCNPI
ncbi:hypothetical protein C1Y40_02821 [Mycobacterium talmoniae]|uniref:Nudix hydrolase domain-containing protein n=1 Tax=Mycobacterium talmoniae TaxID=1858794 RepID=A0A2S8BJY3_9MYCO|nr:hypothetical protein C1Y40_02821 [Mycobacterium talmoniae]